MANPQHSRRSAGGIDSHLRVCLHHLAHVRVVAGMSNASRRMVASSFFSLGLVMTATLLSTSQVHSSQRVLLLHIFNVPQCAGSSLTSRTREKTLNQETIEANCRYSVLRFSICADPSNPRFCSRFFDNDIKKVAQRTLTHSLRSMFSVGAQEIADSRRGYCHGCARGAAHSHWVLKSGCSGPDDRRQCEPYVHIQRTSGAPLKT